LEWRWRLCLGNEKLSFDLELTTVQTRKQNRKLQPVSCKAKEKIVEQIDYIYLLRTEGQQNKCRGPDSSDCDSSANR
jgi:hypothetical protein